VDGQSDQLTDVDESFVVVVNDEDQYSVWWLDRNVPAGWRVIGGPGTREECLTRVAELWTDMRPRGVRDGRIFG
jgi:MbtH protein